MKTNNILKKTLIAGLLMSSAPAFALNTLQLDINGGTYDGATQTIINSGNTFDVYAYGIQPTGGNSNSPPPDIRSIQYYLSAALIGPSGGPVASSVSGLGSFAYTIGLTTTNVAVTSQMVFGTPPLDEYFQSVANVSDPHDLQTHSIFPTYFTQIALPFFNDGQQITPYNTQDRAIAGTPINFSGTGMFYQTVNFDLTNLAAGYDLHWDLYSAALVTCAARSIGCTDIDVNDNAPFSHDAESNGGRTPPPPPPPPDVVPEPTAVWMLGLGLLGLAGYKRRQVKLAA